MMDQRIKELWIEALTSGEYKQGRRLLHNIDNEFCCLGVLCDLHSKETGEKWMQPALFHDHTGHRYNGYSGILPDVVMEWAGLDSDIGEYEAGCGALTTDNDNGLTFAEIAETIKVHF